MSKRRVGIIIAVIIVAGLAILVGSRRFGSTTAETAIATRGSIDVTIQTVGVIQPASSVSVNARSAGIVEQIAVKVGDRVSAGDIVVLLDSQTFQDQIDVASGQLEDAEFALQFAERDLTANPSDDTARANVVSAGEQVTRQQVALDAANSELANAAIVAPTDGVVSQVSVKEGATVDVAQPVAVMFDPSDLELIADVDELDLPNVESGAEVQFRLDAFPATDVNGQVNSTDPVAHQQGGSTIFSAHIEFAIPTNVDIRPGMNADVTIHTARRDNVLLIPDRALRTVGDRSFVTVRNDGHDEEREIHLGYRGNGQVEVVDGLNEGDRVVLH